MNKLHQVYITVTETDYETHPSVFVEAAILVTNAAVVASGDCRA